MADEPLICHRCGISLHAGVGQFFVVKIEAMADPSPPDLTDEDLRRDHRREMDRLVEAMKDLSEQEAMDQVYRKMTLLLCNACYQAWIEDPTGGSTS